MTSYEENTEMADLLEKTLEVENRRKKRMAEETLGKKKEEEKQKEIDLLDRSQSSNLMLQQEDSHTKLLVDEMIQKSAPGVAPIVKFLSNNHCKLFNA